MKILLPYIGNNDVTSNVVVGGIERFVQHFFFSFGKYVIPIQITKRDRERKQTVNIINAAIEKFQPDLVISNEISYPLNSNNKFSNYGIPLIIIIHEPIDRDRRYLKLGSSLQTAIRNGAHVYFVSQNQWNHHKQMYKRIEGINLNGIKGFINPSYCEKMSVSKNFQYDVVSIGRSSTLKDPFKLHRKLQFSGLNTLVMTNNAKYKNETHNAYVDNNKSWLPPQHTCYDLPHKQVMKNLSNSRVFLSTCTKESWGITALEALAYGVPSIFLTDTSNRHSSQIIAARQDHYLLLPNNVSPTELYDAVYLLGKTSFSERQEIAALTQEKHSYANWKRDIEKMIDLRIS